MRILQDADSHPTADMIYEEARKVIPHISKGTVYRNLSVLAGEGLVSELDLSGTVSRYEVMYRRHYHFRCDRCGKVYDLAEPVHEDLDARIAEQTGFTVKYHQMEFRGLCAECVAANQ